MNEHFPLLPDGVVPEKTTVPPTVDEAYVGVADKAYEAFSIVSASAGPRDFYGLRSFRIVQGSHIEVECGYLKGMAPLNGPFVASAPSKDHYGNSCLMVVSFPSIHDWRLTIDGGQYRTGWLFTWKGKPTPGTHGKIQLFPSDAMSCLPSGVEPLCEFDIEL
jgi:hypothetical protein